MARTAHRRHHISSGGHNLSTAHEQFEADWQQSIRALQERVAKNLTNRYEAAILLLLAAKNEKHLKDVIRVFGMPPAGIKYNDKAMRLAEAHAKQYLTFVELRRKIDGSR